MREFLDSMENAMPWLRRMGFTNPGAAHRNLVALAKAGLPMDLLAELRDELSLYLPASADPDMALNNMERMLGAVRSPLSFLTFLQRKPHSLAILLQLFTSSQYFSDLIISSPEHFDFLWEQGSQRFDPKMARDEMISEAKLLDEERILNLLRRHRHRELLRIGYRDVVIGEPLERITESISDLADCLIEVALAIAYRKQAAKYGDPRGEDGELSRLVVLGMGKLGGRELNYSSDIDLILIYDHEGKTDGSRSVDNHEFYAHVIRDMVKLLTANTQRGQAYRVDLRLRPHGHQAPLCLSLARTLAYYDTHGRTWERQALVKVRPVAGWMPLGHRFLDAIQPFIYRRQVTHLEINEIKAIKRRIESATQDAGNESTDLKTGHGGIRDIEFVIQFLQLLQGGNRPNLRERNTLKALAKLADAGCINQDERTALETGYRFLRKAEHRLQFMFDLQTHRIPRSPQELDKLAIRLGFLTGESVRPGEQFLTDLNSIAKRNRGMLNRLMHDLFPDDAAAQRGSAEPEIDLFLDPDPGEARIQKVLGRFRFADVQAAYRNLNRLASEEVPFLSSVRCRHFLASVAPQLLRALAEAADPDLALVNLEKVTSSLGAKGVLWESCSVNPPLLRLYVHLCSWSQFLSGVLIKNPGMIDELLDSLMLDRLPTLEELQSELRGLLRGARDPDPTLHGFQSTHLLGIAVLDILGKQTLVQTGLHLSRLAEAIVGAVFDFHYKFLVTEYGVPALPATKEQAARPCGFLILGLGKFGGKELGYHSDLDLVLLYEGDGATQAGAEILTRDTTVNHHFFSELAQRFIKTTGRLGPLGQLYEIDLRLRPTGHSGSLVVPMEKFVQYYQPGRAALWERQALTRARVAYGDEDFARRFQPLLRDAILNTPWRSGFAKEIRDMRDRLESSRGPNDLKRGFGGIVDVEFAVQMLQMKYGNEYPTLLQPNLWDCLDVAEQSGLWPSARIVAFRAGYTFLRRVESRLRLVHDMDRNDLPDNADDLQKLAWRLGYEGIQASALLRQDIARHRTDIRREFLACLAEA